MFNIVNVSDPVHPIELPPVSASVPGYLFDFTYHGGQLWMGTFENGLGLLRLLREKASAAIPTSGGSLAPASGAARFDVPDGAFSQDVDLSYRRLYYDQPPADRIGIEQTFELAAENAGTDILTALQPSQTITMTLYYTPTELGPVIEGSLGLYAWDGSNWVLEHSSRLDTQVNLLTASVDHLGRWAIFGDALRTYLPLSMQDP
jgi:hypothetical protein